MLRRQAVLLASCLALVVGPSASAATKARKGPKPTASGASRASTTGVRSTPPTVASTAAPTTAAVTAVPPTRPIDGTVSVFAAQSLAASFTDIGAAFEKANPAVRVVLNFAGSSTLVTQIANGAPADVFASADTANMDKLVAAHRIAGAPEVFTRNRPMIVVPKGNPLRVQSLADLARPEVFVALGAPGVPVGDYARQLLAGAGITVTPKTLESNVAAIVNKAALREIDAGIVYVTDVAIDDYRVDGVAIPDEQNVIATYPIASLSEARNPAAAAAFVAYVRSAPGQAILRKYKFLPLK